MITIVEKDLSNVQTKYQKIGTVFRNCEYVVFGLCHLMLYWFQKCTQFSP